MAKWMYVKLYSFNHIISLFELRLLFLIQSCVRTSDVLTRALVRPTPCHFISKSHTFSIPSESCTDGQIEALIFVFPSAQVSTRETSATLIFSDQVGSEDCLDVAFFSCPFFNSSYFRLPRVKRTIHGELDHDRASASWAGFFVRATMLVSLNFSPASSSFRFQQSAISLS